MQKKIEGLSREELEKCAEERLQCANGKSNLAYENSDNIEKVLFILRELKGEYDFCEKPDPVSALKYGSGESKDEHCENSFKYLADYEKIITMISIALDYCFNANKINNSIFEE